MLRSKNNILSFNFNNYYTEAHISNYDFSWIIDGYPKKLIYKLYIEWKINKVEKLFPTNSRIRLLDIGCGEGTFLRYVKKITQDCHGIDASKTAINTAKKQKDINFLCLDVSKTRLPFKNNSFDVITCFDCIEHLEKCSLFLKECQRCLRENGYIFIQTPDGKQPADNDRTHVNLKTKNEWEKILQKYQYNITSSYTYDMYLPTPYLFVQKIIKFVNKLRSYKITQIVLIAQKKIPN